MRALITSADVVRGAIGRAWIGDPGDAEPRALGDVVLHPHQRRAVARLRRTIARDGGALLADTVGMGKTFVALRLAHEASGALVVAPAALRATWRRTAARCGVAIRFVSIESLGRDSNATGAAFVIVDEAHHARNPATKRWRRLAELCVGARVLLLTATPVHNHEHDLRALFRLFLGARADALDGDALLRLVVRRAHADLRADDGRGSTALPRVGPTRWRTTRRDPRVDEALARIPPPLPVADGASADALWRMTLVRLWGSSDAALRAGLKRRLAAAGALEDALAEGRRPTRRDLRAWSYDEGAVQLAMPLLVADVPADGDVGAMRSVVAAHVDGVRRALRVLDERGDRDARRARWLRAVRRRHAGRAIVAFTYSAATAAELYRRLRADGAVAMLTARGGRVASGPLSRAELLARFAPQSAGVPPPRAAERTELLIATDCLSEGLDLRDASVVVHLDVPWTPARLAQRVGRAARLGSAHAAVAVHGLAPAPDVDAHLALARRLRRKRRAARDAVGADGAVRVGRVLERWAALAVGSEPGADGVPIAALPAARAGFLAAIREAGGLRLLAGDARGATDAPLAIARAVRAADRAAEALPLAPAAAERALRTVERRVDRWRAAAAATDTAGIDPAAGPIVRAALARLAATIGAAAPHERVAVAAAAAPLRAALAGPLPAGAEPALRAALADATLGTRWLAGLADALAAARRPSALGGAPAADALLPGASSLVAVLLLRRVQTIRRSHPSERATTDEPDRHAGGDQGTSTASRRPAAVRAQ